MAGLLISGPAGAGKSSRARQVLAQKAGPAVLIEFQEIYADLLGIDRLPSGRYPERREQDAFALGITEYLRRAAITAARDREIDAIVTNSDGDPERRQNLLGFIGLDALEEVIDPGEDVVRSRLSVSGQLSRSCQNAINRWYRSRTR